MIINLNDFAHWLGQVLALTYFIGLFWLFIGGIFVKKSIFEANPKGVKEAMDAFGGKDNPEKARRTVNIGYYLALMVYSIIWPIFLFIKKKKPVEE